MQILKTLWISEPENNAPSATLAATPQRRINFKRDSMA